MLKKPPYPFLFKKKGGITDKTRIMKKSPKNTHRTKFNSVVEYNNTDRMAPIVNNDKDKMRKLFLRSGNFGERFLFVKSLKLKKQDNVSVQRQKSITIINPNQNICGLITLPT